MKNNIWAKTILTAYKYLERICDAIDNMVESNAVNSFYTSGLTFNENSVTQVADRIIALSERKVTLINLKVLIEEAFLVCGQTGREILIEKYIDGDKAKDIAERRNLSMRTYFRRLDQSESKFLEGLAAKGYDEKSLIKMLKGEKWINNIYERFCDDEKEVLLNGKDIKKLVC